MFVLSITPSMGGVLSISLVPEDYPDFSQRDASASFFVVRLPPQGYRTNIPLERTYATSGATKNFNRRITPLFECVVRSSFRGVRIRGFYGLLSRLYMVARSRRLVVSRSYGVIRRFSYVIRLSMMRQATMYVYVFEASGLTFLSTRNVTYQVRASGYSVVVVILYRIGLRFSARSLTYRYPRFMYRQFYSVAIRLGDQCYVISTRGLIYLIIQIARRYQAFSNVLRSRRNRRYIGVFLAST